MSLVVGGFRDWVGMCNQATIALSTHQTNSETILLLYKYINID